MKAQLRSWGISAPGVRTSEPLYKIWVSAIRAREARQAEEGHDGQDDEADANEDMDTATDPSPTKTTHPSPQKRKRKANDNKPGSRKRAKADATKAFEIEAATNREDAQDDDDLDMIDTDGEVAVEARPPRKKVNAQNKLTSQAAASKRNVANKITSKGTSSAGAKTHTLKQTKAMHHPGSDEGPGTREEQSAIGDGERDILGSKEDGVQQAECSVSRRSTRSKSTNKVPANLQLPTEGTAAHKKSVKLNTINEDDQENESDCGVSTLTHLTTTCNEANSEKVLLAKTRGRSNRHAASKLTTSTYGTRSRDAVARNAKASGLEHQESQETKQFWTTQNKTENYCDIPLEETSNILHEDSLDYSQLMSLYKNRRIMARRKALAAGRPWPPKTQKREEPYDYRKEPNWGKID